MFSFKLAFHYERFNKTARGDEKLLSVSDNTASRCFSKLQKNPPKEIENQNKLQNKKKMYLKTCKKRLTEIYSKCDDTKSAENFNKIINLCFEKPPKRFAPLLGYTSTAELKQLKLLLRKYRKTNYF